VSVRFVLDRDEFLSLLRQSDILLSTIAFDSAYPLQDQTCFPTKTLDYFAAGKPVLVVAPDKTDYVRYVKQNGSAMAVTALDSSVVAGCILQLATDMNIRRQLVESGFRALHDRSQRPLLESLNKVLLQCVKPLRT
jgi:glycosyltransferase involved in cell wall biosynthesis